MRVIEPVKITLDKERSLLINHYALYRAEAQVNQLRFARPADYASIDELMVDGLNRMRQRLGMLPMDLLICMLWAGMLHEDPKLTVGQVANWLDEGNCERDVLSAILWQEYMKSAGKNVRQVSEDESDDPDEQKKSPDRLTGSSSGAPDASTLV